MSTRRWAIPVGVGVVALILFFAPVVALVSWSSWVTCGAVADFRPLVTPIYMYLESSERPDFDAMDAYDATIVACNTAVVSRRVAVVVAIATALIALALAVRWRRDPLGAGRRGSGAGPTAPPALALPRPVPSGRDLALSWSAAAVAVVALALLLMPIRIGHPDGMATTCPSIAAVTVGRTPAIPTASTDLTGETSSFLSGTSLDDALFSSIGTDHFVAFCSTGMTARGLVVLGVLGLGGGVLAGVRTRGRTRD